MSIEPGMIPNDQTVSTALQPDSPELVTAFDIEQWADKLDAKETFPELMRRLLAQTLGITNLEIRAHEGIAAPGWDGTAISAGSAYLPEGRLCFEFGANKKVKAKADEDYEKRVEKSINDPDVQVFVFATPRNWPGGQRWAEERRRERKFADVKVIDAHTLEGWLQATPPVHYWLSERLGRNPHGARTLQAWWASFQRNQKKVIPSGFYLAGRDEQAQKFIDALKRRNSKQVSIASTAVEDVLAFVYAVIDKESALVERAMVVTDQGSWARLVKSSTRMLLIPRFDNPDLGRAVERGHQVTVIVDSGSYSNDDATIRLPKVERSRASKVLLKAGFNLDDASHLTELARRSMHSFLRSISTNPAIQKPEWLSDGKAVARLAPLVLVGAWESNDDRDRKHLEKYIGGSMTDVYDLLKSLEEGYDPPFIRSGSTWRLVEPINAARLLLPDKIGTEIVERWEVLVREVLAPAEDGVTHSCSETLYLHVAKGLVLAARLMDKRKVKGIVRELLETAFSDASGDILVDLGPVLPMLAEAAPVEFLNAVRKDIDDRESVTRTLLKRDIRSGLPYLLSALELLCWLDEYYGAAAMLLAAVASLDTGDLKTAGPLDSLYKVTQGRVIECVANVDDRIAVIQQVTKGYPEVGWRLTLELLKPGRSFFGAPRKPEYPTGELSSGDLTGDEYSRYIDAILENAIESVAKRAKRCAELLSLVNHISEGGRSKLLNSVLETVRSASSSWSRDERHIVWRAVTDEIEKNEANRREKWALSKPELDLLRQVREDMASADDPCRYGSLFGLANTIEVDGLRWRDDGFDVALEAAQRRAVDEVLQGEMSDVRLLIMHVDHPEAVGKVLADTDAPVDADIISWLCEDESSKPQRAAQYYVSEKARNRGTAWLNDIQVHSLDRRTQEVLVAAIPMEARFWEWVATLGEELAEVYWQMADLRSTPKGQYAVAAERLAEHNYPWRAAFMLYGMFRGDELLDRDAVKQVLVACGQPPDACRELSGMCYGTVVQGLLQWLESTSPEDSDLPCLEYKFFDFIPGRRPSGALYRALCNDPEFFVDLICEMVDSQESVNKVRSVLSNWPELPGAREDGSIDACHLTKWVEDCRTLFEERDRSNVGDGAIGEVLATSPDGNDGIWPAEVVRDIVEDLKSSSIESGLVTGRLNSRGVSVRGVDDGGKQERLLAQRYCDEAQRIQIQRPRTADVLRQVADVNEQFADYFDELDE
ncbi:MAG: hypothetical protein Q3979_07265 [Actinomycetaceae bacterium]|nr:hypothetical protein [Actinomycetaceae bacterium]